MTRIYYDGGQIWEGDGNPPARGVQAIIKPCDVAGWVIDTGKDYYVKRPDGSWEGVDIFGLFDYLLDSGIVLFGRSINSDEYQAILDDAGRELDRRKSIWLARERKP